MESESCRQRYNVQTFVFPSHDNARLKRQSSRTINVRSIESRTQQKVCLTLFYRYETVSINVEETSRVNCTPCLITYQRSRNQIIQVCIKRLAGRAVDVVVMERTRR